MISPIRFGDSPPAYSPGKTPPAYSPGDAPPPYSPPTLQQGAYGIKNNGVQQYLPVMDKHELDPEDQKLVDKNLHNWFPRIGAGYDTRIPELLASPTKSAILTGMVAGAVGMLGGIAILMQKKLLGAVLGGALGTIAGAVTGFINRRQQNGNLIDTMHRLPPHSTKRDLLSDPVIQKDRELAAMNSGSAGGEMLNGLLMASMMNGMSGGFNSFNSRSRRR
jgi:hypothetical protein